MLFKTRGAELPFTAALFGCFFRFSVMKLEIIEDDRFIVLAFGAGKVQADHRCVGDHVLEAARPVGQDMVGRIKTKR